MAEQIIPSWGKCSVYLHNLSGEGGKWVKCPTPVEDSTQLTPTKGDKMEAKIEGGEPEAVRYKANTYELAYAIRLAEAREMPVKHVDGVVTDEYAVCVVPEAGGKAYGVYIPRSSVSVEDPFNTADGSNWTYTHEALVPGDGGKKVRWGIFTVSGEPGSITITATANKGDFNSADKLNGSSEAV